MNGKQAIAIALPLVGTQLFLLWLKLESRKRPIESPNGAITLKYGLPIWVLGGTCALGFPGFLMYAVYQRSMHAPPDPTGAWPVLLLAAVFAILGSLIMAKAAVNRIVVSSARIAARPIWGRVRTARWEEILEIKFVAIASSLILKTQSGQRIWIDVFMTGFKAFERALMTNVPPNVYGPAIDALHKRYGG